MRVLILGGAGLLGTSLAPKLKAAGHDVALGDNFSGSVRYRTSNDYRLFVTNATDINSLQHTFSTFDPEIVVLAVAYSYGPDIIYKYFEDTKLILDSTNVVGALLTENVKHLYFCSTSEVYGGPQTRKPISETRKIVSSSTHHGAAKLASEGILSLRCQELGIKFTALRIFDLFGPRITFCPRTGMVNFLIDAHMRGRHVGLRGSKRLRDFVHSDDVADAIVGLMPTAFSGTVNVGTGEGVDLRAVSGRITETLSIKTKADEVSDSRLGTFSAVADVSLLDSVLPGGWNPKKNILDEIPNLIEFRKKEAEFASRSNPSVVLNVMRGLANV